MTVSDGMAVSELYYIGKDEIPQMTVLEAGERRDITLVALPGVSADISMRVVLAGEGAEVRINGLYLCRDDERLRINVDVEHKVPHCTSNQLFKGIVGGRAVASFFGKIVVAQDAQKTEACQANHNILLSEGAKVNTKPQLEIYADDVKCSHGATVGRLDEDEAFYMRSRGIPESEARYLQMVSFLHPVIAGIADENVREDLSSVVERDLRDMAATL